MGGAAVTPDVCLQPTAGATVRLIVYLIVPSPRGRTHCRVLWPLSGLLAHCQACGAASMGSGVLAGWIRKVHRGGRGRLSSLCLRWSPVGGALLHLEGGRPIRGMDPQKHSVGHLPSASKFGGGNRFPLEFRLRDGRGKWCLPALLSTSVLLGFNNSPSHRPQAFFKLGLQPVSPKSF